jgi:hypothetical protein
MIVRYHVACENCETVTLVRMGVGHGPKHSGDFECATCGHPISLTMHLDQDAAQVRGAEVSGGGLVDTEDFEHALTVHPDFGTLKAPPDARGFPGGEMSPFLLRPFSPEGPESLYRLGWARASHEAARDAKRVISSYQRSDWDRYAADIARYLPDFPTEQPVDRNRALFQMLELLMAPVATSELHVARISDATKLVTATFLAAPASYVDLVQALLDNGTMDAVLSDVLDIYPRFLELLPKFSPALSEWNAERPINTFPADRDVRGFDAFEAVKSLYVDAYEALCRALTPVMGVVNLRHRGDADAVPAHPRIQKTKPFARNLDDLHGKSNAPKLDLFGDEPAISEVLAAVDPKLRNAAGHKAISFSESKNEVRYAVDRGGKTASMSLGQFLVACLELIRALHVISHYLKIILVHYYLRDEIPTESHS